MWLWQQKRVRKQQLLWAKLFFISFSFHCVFFAWLFFLYHDIGFDIAITVQNNLLVSEPVKFVPFNSSLVHAKLPIKQKGSPVSIQKSREKKIKLKKDEQKKITIKKEEMDNKKTQLVQKKKMATESKPKQLAQKEIKKEAVFTQNKQLETKQASVGQKIVQANYREIEAQRRQALLQKELAHYFKPPIGVPADCICQIKVMVDWSGIIKDLTVMQSSGILMYDVAARSALYTMKMPSWSKGKLLTVIFKQ